MKKDIPPESTPRPSLRLLMVDDSEDDVLLIIREIKRGGYNPFYERVETAEAMKKTLREKRWDIILCDYKMPNFSAPMAIAIVKEANIDTPLIIISGAIGEETATECMRLGAQDYIMKNNLSRLCPAVARELAESEVRNRQRQAECQRKAAIEAMLQSEEKYRTILENIEDGYYEVDLAGNYTFFNNSLCRIHGYTREELMGMNYRQYTEKEYSKKLFETYHEVYRTGQPGKGFGWQIIRKDGTKRYIEASVTLQKDSSGKPIGFRGITRDVTERRMAEFQREAAFNKLRETQDRYNALFERSLDMVYIIDFEGRLIDANDGALNRFGYTRAEMHSMNIASLMDEDQFNYALSLIEEIIKTGVQKDPREIRLRHKNGAVIYVETQGSTIISDGKPIAIQAIARDITERKLAEQKLQQTLNSLKEAVGTTIQVLVSALESRDPYTAGHQSRSAHLACAIAAEMGLPPDKIDGLRMAGAIHDIGKLSIPAEILSKPTKLTNLEFSLIKEHSQSGYDMLKHVESPWPLAQIVYQHHERMNGTGYPRNLKGDGIIIEARIMAVADVVEAMASHRPYRAGLGVDAALEEIKKNKGILYDHAVADACIRLFEEKGYQFPQAVG
jgi:PAS domain S-box-containing protein